MKSNGKILFAWGMCCIWACSVMADPVSERIAHHELRVGTSSPPVDFDPTHIRTYTQQIILKSVYQTLTQTAPEYPLSGDLATWDIDYQKKAYVFHLKPNAQFEDGQPVLAEDVAWSLSRHFWPGSHSIGKNFLNNLFGDTQNVKEGQVLDAITVLDPRTVRIAVKELSGLFLKNLSYPSLSILPKHHFDPMHPISSGPMTAKAEPKTGGWVLTRNPKYIGPATPMEKIVVLKLKSLSEVKTLLQRGEIDLITNVTPLQPDDLPQGFKMLQIPSWEATHLLLNRDKPFFAEKDFCRDLSLLIQHALLPFKKNKVYDVLHTYVPRGVLPPAYYQRELPQSLSPEAFQSKWKKKKGVVTVLIEPEVNDKKLQKIVTEILHDVGLEPKWVLRAVKNNNPISWKQYDLFLTKKTSMLLPLNALYGLQKDFREVQASQNSLSNLENSMQKASKIQNQLARQQAFARSFKEFEEEYDFIPLVQGYYHPMIARSELKIPKMDDKPLLWKAAWQ